MEKNNEGLFLRFSEVCIYHIVHNYFIFNEAVCVKNIDHELFFFQLIIRKRMHRNNGCENVEVRKGNRCQEDASYRIFLQY